MDWTIRLCITSFFFSVMCFLISVCLRFSFWGFLFFYRKDFNGESYKRKLKGRAHALLIPYISWNIIIVFYKHCKN